MVRNRLTSPCCAPSRSFPGKSSPGSSNPGGQISASRCQPPGVFQIALGLALLLAGFVSAQVAEGCRLDAPQVFLAESTPEGRVFLAWTEIEEAIEYEVYRLSYGEEPMAVLSGGQTFYEEGSVPPCVEQTYYVRALGAGACASGPSHFVPVVPVVQAGSTVGNDFDGDSRSDLAFFRPADGSWHWRRFPQPGEEPGEEHRVQWGAAGDWPVPGDYDGDGTTDLAVFRPSTRTWWLRLSCGLGTGAFPWGQETDIPVPADYDGDGRTDAAIYRPEDGSWWVLRSSDGEPFFRSLGQLPGFPMVGDFDADGKADPSFFDPQTSKWSFLQSSDNTVKSHQLCEDDQGQGCKLGAWPAPADYDGDGQTDLATFSPESSQWHILFSSGEPDENEVPWGFSTEWPIPGDYNGDGKASCSAVQAGVQVDSWWIGDSSKGHSPPIHPVLLGVAGDLPLLWPPLLPYTGRF